MIALWIFEAILAFVDGILAGKITIPSKLIAIVGLGFYSVAILLEPYIYPVVSPAGIIFGNSMIVLALFFGYILGLKKRRRSW